ncbi:MAG: hypothetical protein CMI95_02980 [Pelagibacteraceae bacterium]|nr:hypothetical protein [Pelagibacteraceae bacterium]|tara:strand:+ start:314 stop:601 length:288 start_codon:yes stop_codon:yes gene_type:complete
MKNDLKYLKKQIFYKCSHSGIKETDLLYQKVFLDNLNDFYHNELLLILDLFNEYSDLDIFLILNQKKIPNKKFTKLIDKILQKFNGGGGGIRTHE